MTEQNAFSRGIQHDSKDCGNLREGFVPECIAKRTSSRRNRKMRVRMRRKKRRGRSRGGGRGRKQEEEAFEERVEFRHN